MLETIVIVLLILWALGAFVVPIAGNAVHTLLVVVVVLIIYRLVTGRRLD